MLRLALARACCSLSFLFSFRLCNCLSTLFWASLRIRNASIAHWEEISLCVSFTGDRGVLTTVKEVSLGLDTGLVMVWEYFWDSGGLRQELSRDKEGTVASTAALVSAGSNTAAVSLICMLFRCSLKLLSSAMPHDSLLVNIFVSFVPVSFVSGTIGVLMGRFFALSVRKICFFELPLGSRGEKA